ncbi:MAG: Phosphoglycolate phosphatase [Opitutia bacterium UBA7350]|nr:MAG: Phosphoglycolate phosphatase [Opitutae bacterium UBA7350]
MQTVLFDLDGTLIDHFSAIHLSIAHAQRSLGLPVSNYETVKKTVGGSLPVTLSKLIGKDNIPNALPYFHEYFDRVMLQKLSLLPGAEFLLESLYAKGFQLAVFTNKYGKHARAVLEHLKLSHFFELILGTDDSPYRKPEPEFTELALKKLGAHSATTCLIGDSPFDAEAASAGNLKSYLVATGSHTIEALKSDTQADEVFQNLFELATKVFKIQAPKLL